MLEYIQLSVGTMRFQCLQHGEVDEFHVDGYSVAHEGPVKAHEKDFEGITFVIESPKGGNVTAEHVRPEKNRTESYLEKFAGWDSDIAQVMQNYYESSRGVEDLNCPHNHGIGMGITQIVDQVFIPDIDATFEHFGVYDGVLEIGDVHEYPGDVTDLFSGLVEQARNEEGIDMVTFTSNRADEVAEPLENVGFAVVTEENRRRHGTFTRVSAEIEV